MELVILNMHIKFEVSNSNTDWADMMENRLDEKSGLKGTDKLETADSEIQNTTCGMQGLYPISNIYIRLSSP